MRFNHYRSLPYLNNSLLKHIRTCPAKFLKEQQESTFKGSRETLIGNLAHTLILEPDVSLEEEYEIREKDGAVRYKGDEGSFYSVQAVARAIKDSVYADSDAARLLEECDHKESVAVFDVCGVRMKARFDGIITEKGVIIDLKTTGDASERTFKRSICKFGYDMAAGLYSVGATAVLEQTFNHFVFIVVEKTPPFITQVYHFGKHEKGKPSAELQRGVQLFSQSLEKYKECMKSGIWPGYEEGITELTMDDWYFKEAA